MKRTVRLSVVSSVFALLLAFLLMPSQAAHAFGLFLNFNSHAVGTSAENIGTPGLTMYSPYKSHSWQVQTPGTFTTMGGNVLGPTECSESLIVRLDKYYQTVTFRYGISGAQGSLRFQAFSGSPNYGHLLSNINLHVNPTLPGEATMIEGTLTEEIDGADHIVFTFNNGCGVIDDLRFDDMPVLMVPAEIILIPEPRLPLPQPRPLEPVIVLRGN